MRIKYIDRCKAVGIFLIIFYHTIFLHNFADSTYIVNFISLIMLPIFFILSGILKNIHPIILTKKFIRKRVIQLFIPYIIFSLISIFIKVLFFHNGKTVFEIIKNGFYLTFSFRGIDVLWFIPVLFFSEILFLMLFEYNKNFIIVSIPFIIIPLYIVANSHRFSNFLVTESMIPLASYVALIFLLLGYYSHWIISLIEKNTGFQIVIISMYIYGVGLFKSKIDLHYFLFGNNFLMYIFLGFIGSLELIVIFKRTNKMNFKYLDWIGENSLYYMCLHLGLGITTIATGFILSDDTTYVLALGIIYTIIQCIVLVYPTIVFNYIIKRCTQFKIS
ncbi:acyltransferase family protein [Companilactobacillus kimchiensis]|uniref:Acyltransferase 3 domain-containing protein n=1 Tax=Companilactobacillus kimchiensis TaxID=993692 RepID=A0A0R2LPV5_9LACO|nr:acyltransferase family protein [Companilactobacillus kimchiensis]KRO00394.1 hypothetical protein IV57_GL001498 [Companilactobacillus kimchiensis]